MMALSNDGLGHRYMWGEKESVIQSQNNVRNVDDAIFSLEMRIVNARQRNIIARQQLAHRILANQMTVHSKKATTGYSSKNSSATADSYPYGYQAVTSHKNPEMTSQQWEQKRVKGQWSDTPYEYTIPSMASDLARSSPQRHDELSDTESTFHPITSHNPLASTQKKNTSVIRELAAVSTDLAKVVDENTNILTVKNNSRQPPNKRRERDEDEKKLKSYFKRRGPQTLTLLPLWRHQLAGEYNPPADCVLKGKRLFLAVAWGILTVYCRPQLSIRRRRLQQRENYRSDFAKTLSLFIDACSGWMGKIVRVPIVSLAHVSFRNKKEHLSFTNY
jgi:hypothetical protein